MGNSRTLAGILVGILLELSDVYGNKPTMFVHMEMVNRNKSLQQMAICIRRLYSGILIYIQYNKSTFYTKPTL